MNIICKSSVYDVYVIIYHSTQTTHFKLNLDSSLSSHFDQRSTKQYIYVKETVHTYRHYKVLQIYVIVHHFLHT